MPRDGDDNDHCLNGVTPPPFSCDPSAPTPLYPFCFFPRYQGTTRAFMLPTSQGRTEELGLSTSSGRTRISAHPPSHSTNSSSSLFEYMSPKSNQEVEDLEFVLNIKFGFFHTDGMQVKQLEAQVRLRCGSKVDVVNIDEPSHCKYSALLTTSTLCQERRLKELQDKLEAVKMEQPQVRLNDSVIKECVVEMPDEFNITWLHRGDPIHNVSDLSIEASRNLGLLLDQLRYQFVKSLNNMVVIVLIKR
ncbi:unnamed protein product [Lactuca saligna]|uniref:Glucosidase 2 subunit beta-like domain-containing protein n=1 Tax=Lactuca saligna TaxID=75948 RepID=A0AA35ZWN9_LACSI|nr:unnamed protein product [Lactuca saligna]